VVRRGHTAFDQTDGNGAAECL
jgi:hypothetical protein